MQKVVGDTARLGHVGWRIQSLLADGLSLTRAPAGRLGAGDLQSICAYAASPRGKPETSVMHRELWFSPGDCLLGAREISRDASFQGS